MVSASGASSFLQEMMVGNKKKPIKGTILLRNDIRIIESSHKLLNK
jgi:hypothetical protein